MSSVQTVTPSKALVKRTLLGHKGRSFDVRISRGGDGLVSASEDGTCKVWNLSNGKCSHTVVHNKEAEVLRSNFLGNHRICTSGSDGNAIIWRPSEDAAKLEREHVLEHGEDSQIYVCETSDERLLVAADDFMVLWDLETLERAQEFRFTDLAENNSGSTTAFGGHRNPDNQVFVFDAKFNPSDRSVVSVALSDSTTRIVDTRLDHTANTVACVSLARLFEGTAERIGHATSVSWSDDAHTLAVSLGSGQTALIDTRQHQVRALLKCHTGPCYGSLLVEGGSKCVSWSSDCTIRIWDASAACGMCTEPLSVRMIPNFPILAAAWDASNKHVICGGGGGSATQQSTASPAGESGTGSGGAPKSVLKPGFSFIGTPIYVVDCSSSFA